MLLKSIFCSGIQGFKMFFDQFLHSVLAVYFEIVDFGRWRLRLSKLFSVDDNVIFVFKHMLISFRENEYSVSK